MMSEEGAHALILWCRAVVRSGAGRIMGGRLVLLRELSSASMGLRWAQDLGAPVFVADWPELDWLLEAERVDVSAGDMTFVLMDGRIRFVRPLFDSVEVKLVCTAQQLLLRDHDGHRAGCLPVRRIYRQKAPESGIVRSARLEFASCPVL